MSVTTRTTFHIIGGTLLLAALIGYGLFQAQSLIAGPVVTVEKPADGKTVHSSLVTITGETAHISSIELNDRQIYVNKDGEFREKVVLSPGPNIITLEAQDRFGRTTHTRVRLVHRPLNSNDNGLSQSQTDNQGS